MPPFVLTSYWLPGSLAAWRPGGLAACRPGGLAAWYQTAAGWPAGWAVRGGAQRRELQLTGEVLLHWRILHVALQRKLEANPAGIHEPDRKKNNLHA